MNALTTFLTQTYVPELPNYMVVMFGVALATAGYVMFKKNGLISYFSNYGK